MKAWMLAGALVAVGYGGMAFAGEVRDNGGSQPAVTQPGDETTGLRPGDVGDGTTNLRPADLPPVTTPPSDMGPAPRMEPQPGIGGSGTSLDNPPPPAGSAETGALPPASLPVTAAPGMGTYETRRAGPALTGVTILGGGGVERYAGSVADMVKPGVTWGVTVLAKPNKVLGVEVAYSGAANEVNESLLGGIEPSNGADIVRNGASAAISLGAPWAIQPYVVGGLGVNRYTVRGLSSLAGLRSDTGGDIPLGAGIRTDLGPIAADLRFNYNLGFSENFASTQMQNANRYAGTLQLGGAF